MKIVQVHAPSSGHDDETVQKFNEDVDTAINKVKSQYTPVTRDMN